MSTALSNKQLRTLMERFEAVLRRTPSTKPDETLQGIDALAMEQLALDLGFENLDGLKAAAAELTPEPIRVVFVLGREYNNRIDNNEPIEGSDFGDVEIKEFATEQECQAFFRGMELSEGWDLYAAHEDSRIKADSAEGSFLHALKENPNLDYVDWHNNQIEAENDLDGPGI
jgi:hypothetical protein